VYKLSKALYGLKQAPQAWYARLKIFLLQHGYVMGSVDKTLFTLNHGTDFLLVQIYMDDIIFGGSSHTLASRFQEMMDLVGFSMLILRVAGLTERALLGLVIFLDLLSFAGLLENSLQLCSPPPRPSM
jgi:hypothetical protein